MSEAQRNALNALLFQTGEQSYSFMMVHSRGRRSVNVYWFGSSRSPRSVNVYSFGSSRSVF
jgi:hypothetical protein